MTPVELLDKYRPGWEEIVRQDYEAAKAAHRITLGLFVARRAPFSYYGTMNTNTMRPVVLESLETARGADLDLPLADALHTAFRELGPAPDEPEPEPEPTLKPTPLARIADALERVADALEEKAKPKSERVIRVQITEFGPVVKMLLTAHPYVIGSGAVGVGGQPGLFWDPSGSQRLINIRDTIPRHEIEVRAAAFRTAPPSETFGEYLVTVNVQRDFETWNWRDWRKV